MAEGGFVFSPEDGGGATAAETEETAPGSEDERPPDDGGDSAPEATEEEAPAEAPPEQEEEPDVRQAFLDQLTELEKEDPELAQALREKYGVEQPAEQAFEAELGQRQAYHAQAFQQAQEFIRPWTPDMVKQSAEQWAKREAQRVAAEATQLMKGAEGDPSTLLNAEELAKREASLAQAVGESYAQAANLQNLVFARNQIESHPAYRHVPKETRQQIDAAYQQGNPYEVLAAEFRIVLDAAMQAAPETIRSQARQAAEKELGLTERYEKLLSSLGKNGARKGLAAPQKSKDEREKLADPSTPIEELMRIRNRQREQ